VFLCFCSPLTSNWGCRTPQLEFLDGPDTHETHNGCASAFRQTVEKVDTRNAIITVVYTVQRSSDTAHTRSFPHRNDLVTGQRSDHICHVPFYCSRQRLTVQVATAGLGNLLSAERKPALWMRWAGGENALFTREESDREECSDDCSYSMVCLRSLAHRPHLAHGLYAHVYVL